MLDPWGVLVAVGGIAHIAVLILKVFANRLQNCTCVLPFSVVVRHNQHFIFLILSACLFLNAQTCDQRLQREFFGLVSEKVFEIPPARRQLVYDDSNLKLLIQSHTLLYDIMSNFLYLMGLRLY